MKKIFLLILLSCGLDAQTYLQLKQIQPAASGGSVLVTNGSGVLTYTPSLPLSSNAWNINGNSVPTNTNFIGTTNNSSFLIKTNNINALKIDSLQGMTIFSTTATPTLNGSMYYDGGLGGKNGFNFYSSDSSNLSLVFRFSRSGTSLGYYASSAGDNWLQVPINTNFVVSTDGGSTQAYEIDPNQKHSWTGKPSSISNATAIYKYTGANLTGQGAEVPTYFLGASNVQFTTAIALQRTYDIRQSTITFSTASTLTNGASVNIAGPLVASTNATIINNSALNIGGLAGSIGVGSGSMNSYGLTCNAISGGINTYCARFLSGNVGIGTSAPTATLHVVGTLSVSASSGLTGITNTGTMSVSGSSTLAGTAHTSTISVAGSSALTGITNTGTMSVSGTATVTGAALFQANVTCNSNLFGLTSCQSPIFEPTTATDLVIQSRAASSKDVIIKATGTTPIETARFTTGGTFSLTGGMSITGHITGTSTAPTFTLGAGAGSGATATLTTNSTDLAGSISITTAGVPTGAGVVITLTFNGVYGAAPNMVLSPRNAAAAALSGVTMVYVDATTTILTINSGGTGLTTGTVYKWTYQAIQ